MTIDQEVHDLLKADHGEIGQSDGIGGFASSRRLLHGFLARKVHQLPDSGGADPEGQLVEGKGNQRSPGNKDRTIIY